MGKPTPGPWRVGTVQFNDGGKPIMGRDADGEPKRVGTVDCQIEYKRGRGHEVVCAERDANAALFAAAPETAAERDRLRAENAELRKALEALVFGAEGEGNEGEPGYQMYVDGKAIERARAALAKGKA